jgi:hypothetical protein
MNWVMFKLALAMIPFLVVYLRGNGFSDVPMPMDATETIQCGEDLMAALTRVIMN